MALTKVCVHSFIHSAIHAFFHSFMHSPTHLLTHSLTHPPAHSLTHARTHPRTHARTHAPTHPRITNTSTHSQSFHSFRSLFHSTTSPPTHKPCTFPTPWLTHLFTRTTLYDIPLHVHSFNYSHGLSYRVIPAWPFSCTKLQKNVHAYLRMREPRYILYILYFLTHDVDLLCGT